MLTLETGRLVLEPKGLVCYPDSMPSCQISIWSYHRGPFKRTQTAALRRRGRPLKFLIALLLQRLLYWGAGVDDLFTAASCLLWRPIAIGRDATLDEFIVISSTAAAETCRRRYNLYC